MRFSAQLLAAAACLAGTVAAQAKIKIMPLGDSITEITCWRNQVWDNLVSAGLSSRVDFVGSMSNNPQNCVARNSNWDKNHEGHSGYQSVSIANNNLAGWLRSAAPDIVMFHLGTNDINAGTSVQNIINSYTKMVQLMRAQNSRMRIIVATLIPMNNNRASVPPQLNSAIKSWAPSQSTSTSPIYVADVGAGYPVSGLRDQLHPNAAGDQIIANKYSPVLIQAINSLIGGTTPPPPTTPPPTTPPPTTPPPTTPPPTTPPPSTPPPSGCSSMYGQCGGIGYSGPKCCSQGSCKFSNDWYSQCL